MPWVVLFETAFAAEVEALPEGVRDELLARAMLLEAMGPLLQRPYADTLKGSKHANMKELRFEAAGGVWRVAYAFDPRRRAVLLVAGDKSGQSERRFYRRLIEKADRRLDAYLAEMKSKGSRR